MTDAGHRLGIGDLYHRFLHARMPGGNGSQFLFELEGALDPDALRARLDALLLACPGLACRVRGWPWRRTVPVPGWRIPLEIVPAEDGDALFNAHYGRPFPPLSKPGFSVILGQAAGRSLLLLRWTHTLMDAPGCDLLCRLLDGEDAARFKLVDEPPSLVKRAARGAPLWRRLVAVHNLMLRHLLRSVPPPVQAPHRAAAPRVVAHSWSRADSEAIAARGRELSGLDQNAFLVGVAATAAARVFGAAAWRRICVPVPISLRPPAWRGPVLSNYFSSILLHLPVGELGSLEQAVAAVKSRWKLAVARLEDVANLAFLGLTRWLPGPLVALVVQGPTLRDPASLYYSFVELKAGRSGEFLGLPLRRCLIASHILRPPGVAVAFVKAAGRLTAVVPSRGSAIAEPLLAEVRALLEQP